MSAAKGSLLVVDDNAANRQLLSRRLARRGFDLAECSSGRGAIDLLSRRTFDLVLLDLEMPDLDGMQVLAWIRRQWDADTLPVIIVTCRDEPEHLVAALESGANDYVTKPVNLPVIEARVRTQLAHQWALRALKVSEERYRVAVAGSNDGIWDWDLRTGVVHFSERWAAILGLQGRDLNASIDEWFARVHPEDLERVRAEIREATEGRSAHLESQHRVRHHSGSYRWVLSRAAVVAGADGQPGRMAGSLTDITDGKVVDALTGLPNRALFLDRLRWFVDRSRRYPHQLFAVLVVDLDRVKTINDSLGHPAGDELLAAVARRLEKSVRAMDLVVRVPGQGSAAGVHLGPTVARMGGDEFTILLGDVESADGALAVAERVRRTVEAPFAVDGREVFISASIGVVVSAPGGPDAEGLVRDADVAMYRAKTLGGNRVQMFDGALRGLALRKLQLETDLRKAIECSHLDVELQPIVRVSDQKVSGFEALVRWRRDDGRLVRADEFVHVAEECGLVFALDLWVFDRVCRLISTWPSAGYHVAVNVSGRSLRQPDLVERIEYILAESGVAADRLEVEITESAAIDNLQLATSTLQRLRALGLRLSLDDFGTGYSSLSYLHRLPIDTVKIDRSFIDRIGAPSDDREIVRSIVELAHRLKLEVVAEGVETPAQMEALTALGCERAQGYHFSRPLACELARRLLAANVTLPAPLGVPATNVA
jgi:PAS domain S-box-containing protein